MKPWTKALLLAAILGSAVPLAAAAATELPGADSPQEVMKKSRAAAAAGDQAAINNLVEPGFRRDWAAAKLAAADELIGNIEKESASWAEIAASEDPVEKGGFTAEEKAKAARRSREKADEAAEKRRRFTELLGMTGLTPHIAPGTRLSELPDDALAALVEKVDQGKLIAALDDLTLEFEPETALPPPPPGPLEITDYRIEGDRATAKAGDHLVELVRVAGRWYIAPPPRPEIAEPKHGGHHHH